MPPTGNLERIFREQEFFFRVVYNHKGPGHVSDDKREPIYTLNQTLQSLHCEGPPPSLTSRAQSAHATVNPEIESNPYICKYIPSTVVQELSSEYSRRSLQGTQEAVKNALSNPFITGTPEVESGSKKCLLQVYRDSTYRYGQERSAGRNI